MRAAAVNVHPFKPEVYGLLIARARVNVQRERYRAWRKQVEGFKTATGARSTLVHVPEDVWRVGFCADVDPVSVVVDQLEGFDD